MSGYAETTILEQGLRVGKSFLAKPYSADMLLGRVRELLAVAADAAA